jgi:uncharacterized tellurite resistance protein B-like protein
MPFKNFFRSTPKSSDGLNQAAREAIVDVLHYCMYADRHIAVREDEFIEAAARTLDWDPNISYEYYEGKSTGAVSGALANPESKVAFFESIKQRLPGAKERSLVLKLAEDLVLSDGRKDQSEATVIGELKHLLAT